MIVKPKVIDLCGTFLEFSVLVVTLSILLSNKSLAQADRRIIISNNYHNHQAVMATVTLLTLLHLVHHKINID
jgi:hypothetical protein